MKKVLGLLVLLFLISCNEDSNEVVEQLKQSKLVLYSQRSIGWEILVPEKMKCVYYSNSSDSTSSDYGLSFQIDEKNIFQSTIEIAGDTIKESYEDRSQSLKKLFSESYSSNGIKVDSSETSKITLDGIQFNTYEFRIYDDNDSIKMYQLMFSTNINQYDFNVSIVTESLEKQLEFIELLQASKFDRALDSNVKINLIRVN